MRASIEAKLRALYAQRAELQAEQDEDMETESESAPREVHHGGITSRSSGSMATALRRLEAPDNRRQDMDCSSLLAVERYQGVGKTRVYRPCGIVGYSW
jgi:hypothetical protein